VIVSQVLTEMSQSEKSILGYLSVVGPSTANEIARGMDLGAGEILGVLGTLEMKGLVSEEKGIFAIV
jgi:sugar-specific transcriptional regulator TrmB